MTKKQQKDIINSIKENSKIILSSKENARKFLIELGISRKDGSLRSNYR